MSQPIRTKGNAIVVEIPSDISGKKNYEQWGEGVAVSTLEKSSGLDELIVAMKAAVVLGAYIKKLKEAAEEELEKYVGDSYKGVGISRGGGYSTKYDYQYCIHHKELDDAKKELEDILKGVAKKMATPNVVPEGIASAWLNPFTGEQVTLTHEDAPEVKTSKKSPYNIKL